MSSSTGERICQGCAKLCKTKQNYERHIDTCKELAIKLAVEANSAEYEKKLNNLRKELEQSNSLLRRHGILQQNNSYEERFDCLFSKLIVFTQESLVNNIKLIRYQSMLTLGENTVNTNFILYVVNSIKMFVFCTDSTRCKLVIKRDNNICEKINARSFVIECFTKAHRELITLIIDSIQYCRTQESNLPYDDYTTSMNQLILLRTYISQLGVNKIVKMIANNLVTTCDLLIKK